MTGKITKCLVLALIGISTNLMAQSWVQLTTDVSNDGVDPNLLDGTALDYYYDEAADSIHFKVRVAKFTTTTEQAPGVNIMINIPGGGTTFNFWGSDNMNPFHKLVTAWVTGTPPNTYSGTIGVANATGVGTSNYTNLSSNNIDIEVNTSTNNIFLSMKREDLITDAEMGGDSITVECVAAVGSNMFWNDDIISGPADMTIVKENSTPTGIVDKIGDTGRLISVYPNPLVSGSVIRYELDHAASVQLVVYDLQGRKVAELLNENQQTGSHRLPILMNNVKAGAYFLSYLVDGKVVNTSRLIK